MSVQTLALESGGCVGDFLLVTGGEDDREPCLPSWRLISKPIPLFAPVTRATFFPSIAFPSWLLLSQWIDPDHFRLNSA